MLTEIADGVLVHRSEVLRNNTVVVVGGAGALVVDAGITATEMTCLADDPRLTSPEPGWEWVRGIHEHQVALLDERQASRGGS